ncbi:terminase [Castellaniella sp.]|uniref:terminase small subunit-like protein n=1 Tax=Castellaniella sp. TaxID=1955812 RepID=UPI003A4E58F4
MKLTPEKLTAFCAALAEACNVGKACTAVGISRMTAYTWRKDMPDFAAAWDDAMKAGLLALEDEAHRRAFEGVDDPLTYQGQFTYLYRTKRDADGNPIRDEQGMPVQEPVLDAAGNHKIAAVRKYSDTLAIFLLKAHNPEKYRDNARLELAGQLAVTDMTEDEIRAELAALAAAGVVPGTAEPDDVSDLV